MAWRGPRKPRDPALVTPQWRAVCRQIRRARRQPCARCGGYIDYDDRTQGPRSLVVGHIFGRAEARAAGWTIEQINDASNAQPECLTCSRRSGGQEGYRIQQRRPVHRPGDDSARW